MAPSLMSHLLPTTAAVHQSHDEYKEEELMARYVGADCKRCRREKVKLFLKGSKVISAVRSQATFVVKLKFSATKEFAIARDFQFVVSALTPTHVLVKVHALQSLARRRRPSNGRA